MPGPDVSRFLPGGEQFQQPDQTTCGSSSLVMAKMINTPAYGSAILAPAGNAPAILAPTGNGAADPGLADLIAAKQRFAQAVLAMHVSTSGWTDSGGAWQIPWPHQLGTAPWAVARQMSATGGSGLPGRTYHVHVANPLVPAETYGAITAAVDAGQSVPMFIGNNVMARHVVLVTGHPGDDGLSIYDPSCGEWLNSPRAAYVNSELDVAGWNRPWFSILPS